MSELAPPFSALSRLILVLADPVVIEQLSRNGIAGEKKGSCWRVLQDAVECFRNTSWHSYPWEKSCSKRRDSGFWRKIPIRLFRLRISAKPYSCILATYVKGCWRWKEGKSASGTFFQGDRARPKKLVKTRVAHHRFDFSGSYRSNIFFGFTKPSIQPHC